MGPKSILKLLLKTPMVVPSKFTNFFWGSISLTMTVTPINCSGSSRGSRSLTLPATTLAASPDLSGISILPTSDPPACSSAISSASTWMGTTSCALRAPPPPRLDHLPSPVFGSDPQYLMQPAMRPPSPHSRGTTSATPAAPGL